MSRSYRHKPFIRLEKKDNHLLNRRIRHDKLSEIHKGAFYKKFHSEGWDWKYLWTKEQAIKRYEEDLFLQKRYSLKEWLNHWARSARWK